MVLELHEELAVVEDPLVALVYHGGSVGGRQSCLLRFRAEACSHAIVLRETSHSFPYLQWDQGVSALEGQDVGPMMACQSVVLPVGVVDHGQVVTCSSLPSGILH